jgi:hypothetical protein
MKSFTTPTYVFTPGASGVGTVNLSGISGFNIKNLVAVINQTRGVTIYATGGALTKYTALAGTTLTLFVDTSTHNGADVLQVIYEVVGQKTMAESSPVVLASDSPSIAMYRSSMAGTITTGRIAVGTTRVRATIDGVAAPNSGRFLLQITPAEGNGGKIFLGGSNVTVANGIEFVGPDTRTYEFDSADYYLISDTAAQTVGILEKA